MQQLGKNTNDTITFVVAVAIVELLEVIEVGIADGEVVAQRQAPPDFCLDRRRSRQPGRRMNHQVPLRTDQHRGQSADCFGLLHAVANYFVGAGVKRLR